MNGDYSIWSWFATMPQAPANLQVLACAKFGQHKLRPECCGRRICLQRVFKRYAANRFCLVSSFVQCMRIGFMLQKKVFLVDGLQCAFFLLLSLGWSSTKHTFFCALKLKSFEPSVFSMLCMESLTWISPAFSRSLMASL